ncbi:MAG: mandelate racemase/muconate lactonizing enzyme family protein [Candidatus Abyssobacteria bacterium SURF_17]|uniref:Mandelate racemase/muconate lactonizing enzyme family protein n=1 Tax=Candidatus Abyssobacteria bacterium SURF_17 TaxID=2093361 RepID=A0A419EX91_9BACT|nr:MAG: mandelate racemase/muconate lactonizing enzyme family protein [Candidatus Abyssubacteria bacterium SURF_17]
MKITDVKATVLRTHSIFVQVFTDEGITGIGECSPMNPEVIANFVEVALKAVVVNEDPLEVDKLWNKMMFRTYKLGPQGVQPEAIAGIDIALWDIKGKVTGLPIHTLLGGCYRDTFLMYASVGGGGYLSVSDMVTYVENYLKRGFKAFKIRMDLGGSNLACQDFDPKKDYEMFKAVKEVLGEDIPLSFDANNGYSVSTAIAQGRRFEELGIYHYEEPVAQYDYKGIAQVARALDVPVSAGEHEYTRWQFRDLIEQAEVDIIQPDVVKCGGISEMHKIAILGSVYNKHFVPHQTQPTIGTAASLHVCAAIENVNRPQEYTGRNPFLDDIFKEPLVFEDGCIHLPKRPGLGLEIDEEKMKKLAL